MGPLEVGQRLVFEDMIHYTMVKTTTFNGVTHPSIAIWREDGGLDVVRKFGYNDYKRPVVVATMQRPLLSYRKQGPLHFLSNYHHCFSDGASSFFNR